MPIRHRDAHLPRPSLNDKIALRVTGVVGTMICAYLFFILTLVALPAAIHMGLYYVVIWLSTSCLQLVLLPIIMVGQMLAAKKDDAKSDADHQSLLHVAEQNALIISQNAYIIKLLRTMRESNSRP